MNDPLWILAILCLSVALSEWLVRTSFLRHVGTALLVIVVTALATNLGVIPPATRADVPIYGAVFRFVAPLAIFWLLLRVNLSDVLRAGSSMIVLFLIGALGTMVGVFVAMAAVDGFEAFGDKAPGVGGMFVGTYTGGSVNFAALANEYGVVEDGALFAAANAVDALMTVVWMVATLVVPRFLRRNRAAALEPAMRETGGAERDARLGLSDDTETVHPVDLSVLLALGALGVWASRELAPRLSALLGESVPVPETLVLTMLALGLAQVPMIARLRGGRLIGMLGVYVFLAVIGALCDVQAVAHVGPLAFTLLAFVAITVAVHGVMVYGLGFALRIDAEVASVASQANIGGGTSAIAVARSLGRADLVLPGILVGSLGTALGNFLGIATAELLPRVWG